MKWFAGYNVVVVATLAHACSAPGQTLLLSLLNVPLRESFEVDPLWINTSYTLATLAASVPLVFVGRLIDSVGPRRMIAAIALSFAGACLFMASAAHLAMVALGFFFLRLLGQGSLTLAGGHAMAMWFHARLGVLSGLRSVLVYVLWAPLPMLTSGLLQSLGWRWTWALFGVAVGTVLPVLAWTLVRDRPEDLGLVLDGNPQPLSQVGEGEVDGYTMQQALRTPTYWALALAGMLPPMIGTAMLFELVPVLTRRGLDAGTAATAAGAWSVGMAVAALPAGWLADRRFPRAVLLTGLGILGASCLLMVSAGSAWTARLTMGTVAIGTTLTGTMVSTSTARFFGRRHHGAIRSSMSRLFVVASSLGPLAFGVSESWAGDVELALYGLAALCFLIGAFALMPKVLLEHPTKGAQ